MTPLQELRQARREPGVALGLKRLQPDQHATMYFGHAEHGGDEVWINWVESTIKGAGYRALKRMVDVADEHDIVLRLACDDDGSGRLIAYYERLGFHVDPAGGEIMERVPRPSEERALRQWIDSGVLKDESGLPLPLYHASDCLFTLSEMRPSKRGSFGSGFYFAASPEHALVYAEGVEEPNLVQAYACLRRPYQYRIREGELIDSWGEGLVRDVFSEGEALQLINRALETGGSFGDEIGDELLALGHDGIVATYADGSQEIVVFDKSALRTVHPAMQVDLLSQDEKLRFREACHA